MSKQRLIDANKINFKEIIGGESDFAKDVREAVQTFINSQPTIKAKPVRHGKWEDYDGVIRINCSNCGKVYLNTTILEVGKCNFCPNCGAKMDKEE